MPREVAADDGAVAAHYGREGAHRRKVPIPALDPETGAKGERDEPWPVAENYGGGMQDNRDFALIVKGSGWYEAPATDGGQEGVRMWFAGKGQGLPVEEDDEEMPDPWVQRTRLDWAGQRMDEMYVTSMSWSEERQAEWDRMQDEVLPWR